MMKNKALVILSGGQDSSTCLFWAKSKFKEVEAVSFNYHQRNSKEIESAIRIANFSGIKHTVLPLDTLMDLSPNALTSIDIKPQEDNVDDQLPNTLVEGRNMLFITYSAIYAKKKNITNLIIGVSQTDFSGYPDCRIEFINSCERTISLAFGCQFTIYTPLMWLSKAETWKLAHKLGIINIILEETVTCYNGVKGSGCGKCLACKLRKKGYEDFKRLSS